MKKCNLEKLSHLVEKIPRVVIAAILLCFACACNDRPGLFERRYALTEIPGFEIEHLIELLDHEDPNVRYLALSNLLAGGALYPGDEEKTEETEQLAARLTELLNDPAPKVRAVAAYAPINRTGEGAEERLLAVLDDSHPTVRVEALASLAAQWDEEKRFELSPKGTDRVAQLLDDDNLLVRLHALETLGSSYNTERAGAAVQRISLALGDRETPEVLKALEALGQIKGDEAAEILVSRLSDKDERVARVAATGLIERRPDVVEEWILESLKGGEDSDGFLVATLVEVATDRSRAMAISQLYHPERDVRSQWRAILAKIGDQIAFDVLTEDLESMIPSVEKSFAAPSREADRVTEEFHGLLKLISSAEPGRFQFDHEGLKSLLRSTSPHRQLVAMAHLAKKECFDSSPSRGDIVENELVGLLKIASSNKSPVIRAYACEALGMSVSGEAKGILVSQIEDPVFQVRQRAFQALTKHMAATAMLSLEDHLDAANVEQLKEILAAEKDPVRRRILKIIMSHLADRKDGEAKVIKLGFADRIAGDNLHISLPGEFHSLGPVSIERVDAEGNPLQQPWSRGTEMQIPNPNVPGGKIYFRVP